MLSAACHATTPPAAVIATMARKMGLGRTDPATTGTFTSRSYRGFIAPHVRGAQVGQSHSVSSADSFHSRRAVSASRAFFSGLVTRGLPNCLNTGQRYVPAGRSAVTPMTLERDAVLALCGKSLKRACFDDQAR